LIKREVADEATGRFIYGIYQTVLPCPPLEGERGCPQGGGFVTCIIDLFLPYQTYIKQMIYSSFSI